MHYSKFRRPDAVAVLRNSFAWFAKNDGTRDAPISRALGDLLRQNDAISQGPGGVGNVGMGIAAIEGANQPKDLKIESVATDTDGYTEMGAGVAKLLHLDLYTVS